MDLGDGQMPRATRGDNTCNATLHLFLEMPLSLVEQMGNAGIKLGSTYLIYCAQLTGISRNLLDIESSTNLQMSRKRLELLLSSHI